MISVKIRTSTLNYFWFLRTSVCCQSTHSNVLCEAWVDDAVGAHSGVEAPLQKSCHSCSSLGQDLKTTQKSVLAREKIKIFHTLEWLCPALCYRCTTKEFILSGISLEGPALIAEKADVEAELLPSDGGSRAGLLNVSGGTGLDGGCWIVCRWLSELEWDCWLS